MTSQAILEALAPCGLSCEKCFAHVDGEIRKYSRQLNERIRQVVIEAYYAQTRNQARYV